MEAMSRRLPAGHEAFGGDLKVLTAPGHVRYPDVLVLSDAPDPAADTVTPALVFEGLSASTALTDLRVKPEEYAAVGSILAYVILPQDDATDATVLRRAQGWIPEPVVATLELPEIGIIIALDELYGA
jgi:Uma2 family endonuclease